MRFLLEKVKNGIELKINAKYQEDFESSLKLMDENLDEFNLIREQLLETLGSHLDLFLNTFSFTLIRSHPELFSEDITKSLNKALLSLIFKSITYRDPPKKEEPQVQIPPPLLDPDNPEQQPPAPIEDKPEPKIYPPRPEPEPHDFDMLKARSKLKYAYEPADNEETAFNAILKVHNALNYNAPIKEEANDNNENEESFIEPFDGSSFNKLRQQYHGNKSLFIVL